MSLSENTKALKTLFINFEKSDNLPRLSFCALAVFFIVYDEDDFKTVTQFSLLLNKPKSDISRSVNALEAYELLSRQSHPTDNRKVILSRTQKGFQFLGQLERFFYSHQ